jgi:3-oxoadipate enol-lactonase
MIHILSDGNEMYVEHTGNKNAMHSLVFLNGLSQSTVAWTMIKSEFEEKYGVVCCDFLFQGKSSTAKSFRSFDEHAADITSLVDGLNIEKTVLIGISYGSAVAQHALVNYPDRYSGAILLSTFAHSTAIFSAIGETWKIALQKGGYPLMLDIMLPFVLGASYFEQPTFPIDQLKANRSAANLQSESLLQLMKATEKRGDYRKQLTKVTVPVYIAQGEEDLLIPPSVAHEVALAIPKAKFEILPKVGHTLNLEAIPQVKRVIYNFLKHLT